MGGEARTTQTEDFRALEAEMSARQQGMFMSLSKPFLLYGISANLANVLAGLERLSKSMNSYGRWVGRRCDTLEDRERASPIAYFGRTMAAHGEEHEAGSELGNSLVAVGQANERIAGLQDALLEQANSSWTENLERSLAMMKEYNVSDCSGHRLRKTCLLTDCV